MIEYTPNFVLPIPEPKLANLFLRMRVIKIHLRAIEGLDNLCLIILKRCGFELKDSHEVLVGELE